MIRLIPVGDKFVLHCSHTISCYQAATKIQSVRKCGSKMAYFAARMQQLDCLEGWRACRMKQSAAKYKNTVNTIKGSIIINVLFLLKIVPNNNSRKKNSTWPFNCLPPSIRLTISQAINTSALQCRQFDAQGHWPVGQKFSLVSPLGFFSKVHSWMFPKNRGGKPPKWMVKIMENLIKMDDLGVPIFLG